MRFVKGRLYRVIGNYKPCKGCVLKYLGINNNGHHGKQIKGGTCTPGIGGVCYTSFKAYKIIEHIDMVKFCKKLRKERKNET